MNIDTKKLRELAEALVALNLPAGAFGRKLPIEATEVIALLDDNERLLRVCDNWESTYSEATNDLREQLAAANAEIERLRDIKNHDAHAKYGWNPDDGGGVMVAKKILTSGYMVGEDVGRICRAHLDQHEQLAAALAARDEACDIADDAVLRHDAGLMTIAERRVAQEDLRRLRKVGAK